MGGLQKGRTTEAINKRYLPLFWLHVFLVAKYEYIQPLADQWLFANFCPALKVAMCTQVIG